MVREYLRRPAVTAAAFLALAGRSAGAQAIPAVDARAERPVAPSTVKSFCYAPRPARLCRGFVMVEAAGGRFLAGTHGHYYGDDRRDLDDLFGVAYGVMRNVSPSTAWGAVVLLSSAPDGFEVRHRRWLDSTSAALDLGIGLAVGRGMYMVPDTGPAMGITGSATLWGNRALGLFARGLVIQDDSAHVSTGLWLGVQTGSSLALVIGPLYHAFAVSMRGW